MSQPLLIRGARQLLTLSGQEGPRRGSAMNEIRVIPDGALLLADGRIQEIGPSRRVEHVKAAKEAIELDATGRVVMPGFVDSFTRLLCGPPISPSAEAALRLVRGYTPQRMDLEGRRRLRQFLRCGTTTLAASCGYGMDEQTEYKALRVLGKLNDRPLWLTPWFFGASGCPPEYEGRPDEYLRWVAAEVLPEISKRTLCDETVVSDCFSPEAIEDYRRAAHALSMKAHLKSAGMVATESGVSILLPGESFHRGIPYPPARALIDSGGAVALATGYDHMDSPSCSIPMMMAIAVKQMGMTPEEAINAATINAAHALGLERWVGSFVCDKQADVLILNVSDYRELSHCFGMNPVALVIRAGEEIYPRVETV